MDEDNNPRTVTPELCEAYRNSMTNQIQGLKDDIKTVDGRLWKVSAGILVTILLTLVSIIVNFL